jgi:hypothetical protein
MESVSQGPRVSQMAGDPPMPAGAYNLAALGYVEREFLIEGVATSFALIGERTSDGRWTVRPDTEMPFVTRFVVRTPSDPARFSGTVAVEWHNVSGGVDVGPDWMLLHRDFIAQGHGWVGVSAQKAGIDGGGLVEGMHLKKLAPDRYGQLQHPGDGWSFDIFTQVARVLRSRDEDAPLGGLVPERLIAIGESQSAAFLVTYINGVDFEAREFDGFLVHGRGAGGAGLDGFRVSRGGDLDEATRSVLGSPERIREDVRVPVLVLQSETDVILLGGGLSAQPDCERLRLWEIAGAAHADTYLLVAGGEDDGGLAPDRLAALLRPTTELLFGNTDTPINSGPQQHYVGQAAFEHLVRWIAGGPTPPAVSRLDLADGGGLRLDVHGNATGGVRTPWVDVPVARLSGLGQSGQSFAILFGKTEPFDRSALDTIYPGGQDEYMAKFTKSLDQAIVEGFILASDRHEILALAGAASPFQSR